MKPPIPNNTQGETKMKKLTKLEMLEEIILERNKEMTPTAIGNAIKYSTQKSYDYVTKVYQLFLLDKEHVEFYYALLVR